MATRPPPAARPLPCTIRSSPAISTSTPLTRSIVGGGGQPVGFLDPQFLQAAHDRRAFGEGRRHRQHRIFVDHRRARAPPAPRRRAVRRRARASRRHRLAGFAADSHAARSRRPSRASVVNSPVRSGLVMTPAQNHVRARRRSAPRPAETPPTTDRRAPRPAARDSSGWPVSVMRRPWRPSRLDAASRRRNARASFRYGRALASASITAVSPGAASPASSTADLICAEATGGSNTIGIGSRAPGKRQRQAAARSHVSVPRADPFQRIEHAPHRPPAQRGVAVERRRDRAAGDRARAPAGSRCRNCRNRAAPAGSAKPPTPTPWTRQAPSPVRSTRAPSARMALAVLRTSSPSRRPEIRVSPTASAPKSARGAKSICRRARARGPSAGRCGGRKAGRDRCP